MFEKINVLENAQIVMQDHVEQGWIVVEDGKIKEIGTGKSPEKGFDCRGDYLIPGLVELHTDHLESHFIPRPKVKWHPISSVLAYDAQIAASGITTVFDSLRAGFDLDGGGAAAELMTLAGAIAEVRDQNMLRCDHKTHLRCELPTDDVVDTIEEFLKKYSIDLISLMDHTPGQRQFRDLEKYKIYYGGKRSNGMDDLNSLIHHRVKNGAARAASTKPALVALARRHGIPIASHDDTTSDDVMQSVTADVSIAEFPTTLEAAKECRAHNIAIMMGAPNLIRGGSHSGNVAAETLAEEGLLDIFSSDYVPGSLIMAAFSLPQMVETFTLPQAVATVTATPAKAANLTDRGEIAINKRADLVRVNTRNGVPVVRQVWRQGIRVI